MPLVRVAGTQAPDENPLFWQNWQELGHAIVARAVYDYVSFRKKKEHDQNGFPFAKNSLVYEKFFRSKYFGRICPKYDGHLLYELLEAGAWKRIPRVHHSTQNPHSKKEKEYTPKLNRDRRGRHCKYD